MGTDEYFAGLIDGEGCVGMSQSNRAPAGSKAFKPYIKVNMTCQKTVQAIRDHFDMGSVKPRACVPANNKPQWVWYVHGENARAVARRMMPLSITKREAYANLLEKCVLINKRRVV